MSLERVVYGLIAISILSVGLSLSVASLALRLGGLKSELVESKNAGRLWRDFAEDIQEELSSFRDAHKRRIDALEAELAAYRATLSDLPDTPSARDAVRAELDRQLARLRREEATGPTDPNG